MKFIDWFAGIGGFRRGMELAGHICVGFCEFDKYATASYISMHCITNTQRDFLGHLDLKTRQQEILKDEYLNNEWYRSDITKVKGIEIPKVDCWCFGAPCQSFSLSGKREGLNGESGLINEIFRLIGEIGEEDRPEWLIYENVKGMFSSNRGFDYLAILNSMDELGYDCEWQLFNSKNFGIPQNRERVYTIGHYRRRGSRKIFPLQRENEEFTLSVKKVGNCYHSGGQNGNIYSIEGLAPTISAGTGNKGSGIGSSNAPKIAIAVKPQVIGGIGEKKSNSGRQYYQQDRVYDGTKVSCALCSGQLDGVYMYAFPCSIYSNKASVGKHAIGKIVDFIEDFIIIELNNGSTVWAKWFEKKNCYIIVRRLTAKECFRLQGWTDDYYEKAAFINSETQLYKQAGNGVTVNIVEEIGKQL